MATLWEATCSELHADSILTYTVYRYTECVFRGKALKAGTTFKEACQKW